VKQAFVETLKTPALLAMFSKDPVSTTLAQATLKTLSVLEPNIIMPAILERVYNGLESINEVRIYGCPGSYPRLTIGCLQTHRTTAVLSCLSGVASTLVSENIFLGGQKHLMPLLELALPGLDINDPLKVSRT
jgi:proteasome activator subunit 4